MPGCPKYGFKYDGGMGVADDNCCYCAGIGVSMIVLVNSCCVVCVSLRHTIYFCFTMSILSRLLTSSHPITSFPTPSLPGVQHPTSPPSIGPSIGCGYGYVGDGICIKTKMCCSIFGWCGYGDDYCGDNRYIITGTREEDFHSFSYDFL